MSLLQKFLWSLNDVQDRLKSSHARHASKYSEDSTEGHESSIPLLPQTMADDKHKPVSPVIEAVGSDSESNSRDVTSEYKKRPGGLTSGYVQVSSLVETGSNISEGL